MIFVEIVLGGFRGFCGRLARVCGLFCNFAAMNVELLAPARDAAVAIEAIRHGADAIYIGAPTHGARASARCTVEEIRRVVEAAHPFNVRVYVTLNTLIYNDEVEAIEREAWQLYRAGVDALIVQDLGLLRMNLPPIALHASTQCDTRTPAKAQMLQQAGFSQIVVARELNISELQAVCEAVTVSVEAFVHGALCVCFSGDCRASLVTTGRSANRGECAQICRYAFDLKDADGKTLVRDKHLLSLRDMNRSRQLGEMLEAGVRSLKIEGRLKDAAYVKNITALYHNLLTDMGVSRTSSPGTEIHFTPDADRTFNRGYTSYIFSGRTSQHMASTDTPKAVGPHVATVTAVRGKSITVRALRPITNGDGLGYFDTDGRYHGFRVNRVTGNTLEVRQEIPDLSMGTRLYRNADKAFTDLLEGETATRHIDISLTLRALPWQGRIVLEATDVRGNAVTVTADAEIGEARTPQAEARRRVLTKTGGTIYRVTGVDDRCGGLFIPASTLTALRRTLTDRLDSAQRMTYRYDYRRPESADLHTLSKLTYHDNVANDRAAEFYRSHGTAEIEPAAEVERPKGPVRVMTTRYCLRRELGRCLLTPDGREWKEPLTLVSGPNRFTLSFDCKNCLMNVTL